jgi:hypothetical protein
MFFDGLSHHHGAPGEASPYDDDGHHSVVVFLTFAIFFSFVVIWPWQSLLWPWLSPSATSPPAAAMQP